MKYLPLDVKQQSINQLLKWEMIFLYLVINHCIFEQEPKRNISYVLLFSLNSHSVTTRCLCMTSRCKKIFSIYIWKNIFGFSHREENCTALFLHLLFEFASYRKFLLYVFKVNKSVVNGLFEKPGILYLSNSFWRS